MYTITLNHCRNEILSCASDVSRSFIASAEKAGVRAEAQVRAGDSFY